MIAVALLIGILFCGNRRTHKRRMYRKPTRARLCRTSGATSVEPGT